MEYRILGKLDVLRDGESVDLGAFRQRAMLAMLLTSPNTVFSTDQLIDGLWGDDGSVDRQNSLWVYVSGLRKALEPEREKRSDGTILLTRAPGYLLEAEPDEIDAVRFERMIGEGRSLAETDPAAASLVFGEALALWRGRAFEDFTYESFAQTEIARLEGLRLEVVEARIDADLDRGMSRELVSELETLVRQHPLQERLTGQLMLALYRSGRQADALRSYQMLKSRLGDELGVEPSNSIRRLEEQIVTGDAALESGARGALPGSGPVAGLVVRGYELREKIGEGAFGVAYRAYQPAVGREVAIKVIRPELANDPDFIRRFEAEAQVVARLEHPHIVPLYDYWREPDAAYLVMRLMKGGSLADVLETSALTPEKANRVLDQLGSALQTAHRSGVVHRDIKPDNILIDDEGNAYLSDFGIAVGADGDAGQVGSVTATLGPPYASPEALERGEVTTASDVYSLGVVIAQAMTGLSGEIVQVRGALPPPTRRVIDRATAAGADDRYHDVTAFVTDMREAFGDVEPVAVDTDIGLDNPYKGLRSFDAADTDDFFGRERLVERLIARLGEPGSRGRFVAVVGPSGSGKSSVVKAGLLPALRRGALPLSENWFTVTMTPAPHPFEELEDALLGIAVNPPASLLEQIAGENGLHRALRRVMPEDGSQLLLVIDQFEELFTQVDPDTARAFLDVVASAANDEHSRVRVVVTLRADFYDRPLRHRGIGELLRDGTEAITPMTPEELERAITGPVEALGVTYEPALVAELVRDVVDRAGALPLLQYALTELFDARQGQRITDAAYRELGGVSGALVERAEGLLSQLGEHAHEATRQVFLRLVTLGDGADDTRRRVLRSELEQLDVDPQILAGVLDTFGRHRLLSFDRDPVTRGPTVEISHEALLTEWTRLRDWIDGARHDVRNQRRLAEAMGEWVAAGQEDAYLLRGGRLEQLHGWATTTSLPLSGPEQEFLDASVADRDRADSDERDREQRAVDAELRARHRSRQLLGAGVAGTLVALLAVFGIVQWRSATDAKDDVDRLIAVSDLVSAADVARDSDPELALLLAVQAVRETVDLGFATEESVDAIHWSLQELGVQYEVDSGTPVAVRSGPKGLTGVYVIPPAELVAFAEGVTERQLTDAECDRFFSGGCPSTRAVPAGLPLRAGDDSYGSTSGPGALAGTRVRLLASWGREDALDNQFAAFSEETGIVVEFTGGGVNDELHRLQVGERDFPDLGAWPQPAAIEFWVGKGELMDLGEYLDEDTLRSDFGEYLLSLGTIGNDLAWPSDVGTIHAVPVDVDLKGLVYYPKGAFDAAGYEVPDTFDQLVELSSRMVADGQEPWCFGFGSGPASGWPGTDLIESLVIRGGGVDLYEDWTFGRVPFETEAVLSAGRRADSLVSEPGFVRSGRASISGGFFVDQLLFMLQRDRVTDQIEPQCWFLHQGDFMLSDGPPGTRIGVDLDFFLFPPIDPGLPTPVTGGGNFMGAFADRPEVRALVEFMSSPQWGEVWSADPVGANFISPNTRFDVTKYGANADEATAAVRQTIGSEVKVALDAGVWRYDASDLMPGAVGAFGETGPGAFWTGMLDWADGIKSIEEVFAEIDAVWAELEAAEGG